jgi:hypothetical protein
MFCLFIYLFIYFIKNFFYCFIIHMCIQGLGHFSPLLLNRSMFCLDLTMFGTVQAYDLQLTSGTMHWIPAQSGKENFIQDCCNKGEGDCYYRGERLNSTSPKRRQENFFCSTGT